MPYTTDLRRKCFHCLYCFTRPKTKCVRTWSSAKSKGHCSDAANFLTASTRSVGTEALRAARDRRTREQPVREWRTEWGLAWPRSFSNSKGSEKLAISDHFRSTSSLLVFTWFGELRTINKETGEPRPYRWSPWSRPFRGNMRGANASATLLLNADCGKTRGQLTLQFMII